MNTRILQSLTLALLGCVTTACFAVPRPNVVLFLVDDLGYMDVGANNPGCFYPTPNIDRLAKEGMRFTDGYAACNVCSPTRAAVMTGKYPPRVNITDWLPGRGDKPDQLLKVPKLADGLALEEFTLAEALKEGGYRTAIVGKWHLGAKAFRPELQGFDVNIGGYEKGHPPSYFSPYRMPVLADGPEGEYLTDRLTDEALKFLEETVKADQPFFLYFPHYAVHTPLQAKADRVAEFQQRAATLSDTGPEFTRDLGRNVRQVQNHPTYAAMMESLDQSVGRVMAQLTTLGIETNTLVIFTSDNGGLSTAEGTPTSNVPLRMGKGWAHEGGVRVPLIIKWPGVTPPGSINTLPVISMDYYPTLIEVAGLPDRAEQHLDGVSIVPALRGQAQGRGAIFWHYPHYSNQGGPPHGAVREGQWKLIEWYEDGRVELLNLKDDLSERTNLAPQFPERARALQAKLAAWRSQVNAVMPTPNPDYRQARQRNRSNPSAGRAEPSLLRGERDGRHSPVAQSCTAGVSGPLVTAGDDTTERGSVTRSPLRRSERYRRASRCWHSRVAAGHRPALLGLRLCHVVTCHRIAFGKLTSVFKLPALGVELCRVQLCGTANSKSALRGWRSFTTDLDHPTI